jgi:toxin HigB-1
VIKAIRHRGLKRLYEKDERRGLAADQVDKIARILARLDEADRPDNMDLPGFRLHPLKGDLKGFWAVSVSGNCGSSFGSKAATPTTSISSITIRRFLSWRCLTRRIPAFRSSTTASSRWVTKAALVLGVTRQTLNDLIHGRRGISPEMAIRLEMAFGGGAETWVRMQAAYDLAQARKRADKIDIKRYERH